MTRSLLALAALLALASCNRDSAPPAATPPAQATEPVASAGFQPQITADDFAAHVRTLSSDAFEGRGPGSAGEDKTVAYLQAQFERIGLEPGNGGQWTQVVPMVETTADPSTVLMLDVAGQRRELKSGDDMMIGTRSGEAKVSIADSALVFVGYGVDAPEQGWNDYAGIDVAGKTVVMWSTIGFPRQRRVVVRRQPDDLYGRWTYKFDEAAARAQRLR